jgi:antibiotic biosynthesis monooxygenase (ABM) superfamily enzyme
MSLPETILVVSATIDPAVEADWNRWYNEEHLPEIVDCPGFRSGQRYVSQGADGTRKYVAIYELDDASALQTAEFSARRGWSVFKDKVSFESVEYKRIAQIVG